MSRKFSEKNKNGFVTGMSAKDHFRNQEKIKLESLPFGQNMRQAKLILRELDYIMKKYNITYYLTSGLCLGLVRDGKPIPWDDDIGLGIVFETQTQKANLIAELMNRGYMILSCTGYMPSRINSEALSLEEYNALRFSMLTSSVGMVEYSLLKNKMIVALFKITYLPSMGKVMIGKGKRIYPIKYYQEYDTVEYNNIEFKTPHPVEEYLEVCYGKDWRTPLDYKKKHIEDFVGL